MAPPPPPPPHATASETIVSGDPMSEEYEYTRDIEINEEEPQPSAENAMDTDDEVEALANTVQEGFVEHGPRDQYKNKMTKGRKERVNKFNEWIEVKAQEWKDASKAREDELFNDEKLSAKALIHQATKVITEPREYQLELFEVAKQKNCLAVLDTGSGKTLIACLLIRHTLNQELESRLQGNPKRVTFFLVDSVNLVFQQTAVLSCNLDAKVGRYYGDFMDSQRMWNIETWKEILAEDQVIVMTADVLFNLLTHNFVSITNINLLIFDEAHHAKKNHVYARIIRDFYLHVPEEKRPKIFGLTASPVDARTNVVQAATELEKLLHSQIVTTSDLSLLQSAIRRPDEKVMKYDKLKAPEDTPLTAKMRQEYGTIKAIKKICTYSNEASAELGSWCADRIWLYALSETEAVKMQRRQERENAFQMNFKGQLYGIDTNRVKHEVTKEEIAEMDAELAKIRKAHDFVKTCNFPPPKFTAEDTSSKVIQLYRVLKTLYSKSDQKRTIVFVTKRFTARVLYDLLKDVSPNCKLGYIMGSRAGEGGDENFTFRRQMLSVSRFRRGKLNCLIATSVAEEGLDVPDCNVVIRFDLYSTMIQYIQSRGRARHANSIYLHMYEEGNNAQFKMINDCLGAEQVMRDFCQSLPENRQLDKHGMEHKSIQSNDCFYVEPITGAKLTYASAQNIICHYVGNLEADGTDVTQETYYVRPVVGGRYVCELILPANADVKYIMGPEMPNKAQAKRAAAFNMVIELRRAGGLDEYLLPRMKLKSRPKYANARLALDENKTNSYRWRRKPAFWKLEKGSPPPEMLWLTVILLDLPEDMWHGYQMKPFGILTREKLPDIPNFPIYGSKGQEITVKIVRMCQPIQITYQMLLVLDSFIDRVFFDLFNKHFVYSYDTTRYWFVPLKGTYSDHKNLSEECDSKSIFNWELLLEAYWNKQRQWDPETDDPKDLENKFFIDRVDRSKRFLVHRHVPGKKGSDLVTLGLKPGASYRNIQDFAYNYGKKKKWAAMRWQLPSAETEPVLLSENLLHRLNFLIPPNEHEIAADLTVEIVPSNFTISMIPATYIRAFMCFPCISTRIDAYLHAWELAKQLRLGDMDLALTLEAITKDADNTDQPEALQVNKIKGMGNNYERLEFLGDCYLKLGTSIALFCVDAENEFHMHVERMTLICNQNLFKSAMVLGIPAYVQTRGFSRRTWYPDMVLLSGKKTKELVKDSSHVLGDKTVADVCEALIGAALLDKGMDGAAKMTSSILLSDRHKVECFEDYYKVYVKPEYQTAAPTAAQVKLADDIFEQFGYRFKSPKLLMSAFTHASNPFSWEKVPSYQRLEFLGDALLDLAIVEHIFRTYPDKDPQWLTEHKMEMASNKFLGALCVELNLHSKIRKVGSQLDHSITDYTRTITEIRENSDRIDYWREKGSPVAPKLLSDIIEALVGAMFVDSEFDYSLVEKFFNDIIAPYFRDISIFENAAAMHPSTYITRKMQDMQCRNWSFETENFRPDDDEEKIITALMIHGEIFSYGKETSARQGKFIAAENAVAKIEEMGQEAFEKLCTCIPEDLELKKAAMESMKKDIDLAKAYIDDE